MPNKKIITKQSISQSQYLAAKELRQKMTPEELLLWQHLRANRLCGFHFRRQQIIDRFFVDFYCHQTNLVIEVDGPIHEDQAEYDRERDEYLSNLGLTVLRFKNQEINVSLELVLEKILSYCQDNEKAKSFLE